MLEIDPELSPDRVDRVFEVKDNSMIAYRFFTGNIIFRHYKAIDDKCLRLGVSTFFDMVNVVIKGISEYSGFFRICSKQRKQITTAILYHGGLASVLLIHNRTDKKEKTTNNSNDGGDNAGLPE